MPKKTVTIPILSALCLITFGLLVLQEPGTPSRFNEYFVSFQNKSFLEGVRGFMPQSEAGNSTGEPNAVLVQYDCRKSVPCNFTFVINHPSLCSGTTEYLFAVISAPSNVKSRDAIRDTWGGYAMQKYNATVIFLIGLTGNDDRLQATIENEDAAHGDMIQGDFLDSYKNLSIKSVAMLRWHQAFCPQASYLLKVDDDILINVDALLGALASRKDDDRVILGLLGHGWRPIRNPQNKWFISVEQYSKDSYPDFVTGPTYIVSRAAVGPLYEASLTVPHLPLEDVYLTGLVGEKARVPRVNFKGVGNFRTPLKKIAKSYNSHDHSPNELRMLWRRLFPKW